MRGMRAAVAAVAAVAALAGVTGASAATFDVGSQASPTGQTGSVAFAATASGSLRFVITSGAGIPLNCTSVSASGTVDTGDGFALPGPTAIGSVVLAMSNCVGPLNLATTVDCTGAPQAALRVGGSPTGSPATTPGSITGIHCVTRFTATGCTANLTGSVQVSYTNPTATTDGRLRIFVSGQSLAVSGSGCPAIIPNGALDLGAPGLGSTGLADLEYTVTGDTLQQPFVTGTM